MNQQLRNILLASTMIMTACQKPSGKASTAESGEIATGAMGSIRAHAHLSPIKLNADLRTIIRENDRVQIDPSARDSVSHLVTIGKGELPYQAPFEPLPESF